MVWPPNTLQAYSGLWVQYLRIVCPVTFSSRGPISLLAFGVVAPQDSPALALGEKHAGREERMPECAASPS